MLAERQTQTGTWGISQSVRRALSRVILDLRAALEDDFRKQLRALGVREEGVQPPPAGRTLTPSDQRVRDVASAVIRREVEGGASQEQAFETYVRDSAFTFLNRVVGLRCLEERGLLLVNGQPETAIKLDPARNASSLYWRVRNELGSATPPREVWRETLRRAGAAISQQVRVLFDPESEYAALLPLQTTLQQVIDALNDPEIPSETYAQDELLGWVYQYYNAREKDAAYARLAKGKKLDQPEELIAATCLYTERYMVDYLLQNTLGALWLDMHPDSTLPERWPYFVRRPEGEPRFDRPSRPLREITLMDPACGSGHFLVRAFDLLVAMYREESREPESEIPHLIIERNLNGIDIDLRAVQIAALALYLKGCELAGPIFRPRRLNLVAADALLPGDEPPADLLARLGGDREAEALVQAIWQGLKNVREFGSLLHPERAVDEVIERRRERERGQLWEWDDARWEQWKHELLHGLREEFERQAQSKDLGQRLFGEEAVKGVSLVEAIGRKYDVVVMNPPYAGSGNLSPELKAFVEHEYKEGKRDLFAAFIQRCRDFAGKGGHVGMVTQQSWLFLRSFGALRKDMLERTTVVTLTQLGPHAFEEIGGEVVKIALFTLCAEVPDPEHRLVGLRLIGPKSAEEKDSLLRRALNGHAADVGSTPRQADFLPIPEAPFVYWLRPRFFELLQSNERLHDVAEVRRGLGTADDERFARRFWEVPRVGSASEPEGGRWFWFAKGGGYRKWVGLESMVVNWENDGEAIKQFALTTPGTTHWTRNVRSPTFYFRPGLTYSRMASGSMATRLMDDSIFATVAYGIFPINGEPREALAAFLSTRAVSFLLRVLTQDLNFESGYVDVLPMPQVRIDGLAPIGKRCTELKLSLVRSDPTERRFLGTVAERPIEDSLLSRIMSIEDGQLRAQAVLHAWEGASEEVTCQLYELPEADIAVVLDETGMPSAWYPLVAGHDVIPSLEGEAGGPEELRAHLNSHQRSVLAAEGLSDLKRRLRALYVVGPGATGREGASEKNDGGEEGMALGAYVPVPAETFLEELSQKLKTHPISVYCLLNEMRINEDLVSPPELKRHLEDYVSITVLRLLGYRWPEQEKCEEEHRPTFDSELITEDGIISLVACGDQATALDLIRARLEHDFGTDGAERSEREFREWVGRDLEEWLCRDFFRRHIQQFKQRPIAWHLVSPERTFEAFVLYHKLSRATLQKLRAQYAGGLIAQLSAEQERARQRGAAEEVSRLQLQIEDVEEFRTRLEKIERGDELRYRIRCRWKGEEESGRPGPYAPDIDDGVKVNIRPFQEAGLLAVKEVIKKW